METITTDVLVIGAGAAGIRAVLAACEAGVDVLMVAKGAVTESGSTFSPISRGWGIQALVGQERTEENLEAFYDDIMRVGLGVCDQKLVRIMVEESGPRLEDLISYGIQFRKDSRGDYVRAKGCFSEYFRAFVTVDYENIQKSFMSVLRHCAVKIVNGYVLDLIIRDCTCWGAWVLTNRNEIVKVNAKATVLATGGGAGIFKDHLVSEAEIGDGYALAHRAGAGLKNMEFIQFMLGLKREGARLFLPLSDLRIPVVLKDHEGRDLLEVRVPDARARAAAVADRQKHFPFSSRDSSCQVDIAVASERQKGRKVFWGKEFRTEGDPEIVHFSHAFNGGIKIDEQAESTVRSLFAAGEVVAGPHGADRIGGCMMTATQVFGRRAGENAARRARSSRSQGFPKVGKTRDIAWGKDKIIMIHDEYFSDVAVEVRDAMRTYAMVLRSAEGLEKCNKILCDLEFQLKEINEKEAIPPCRYFALQNMILTGQLIVKSAITRRLRLGPHFREDSPASN